MLRRPLFAILAATAWAFGVSWVIAMLLHRFWGLRVTEEIESTGLDQGLHAESAYDLGNLRSLGRIP